MAEEYPQKKNYEFPFPIRSRLLPDILVIQDRKIYIVELTIPWEHNIDNARCRKTLKYLPLFKEINDMGYVASFWAIEVSKQRRGHEFRRLIT